MSVQQEKFKAIADKIRKYLANDDLIKPNDFAKKIDGAVNYQISLAYTAGYSEGEEIGYTNGWYDGNVEGEELGKQSVYNDFWDEYQENGNRTYYQNAFEGAFWTQERYESKAYPIGSTVYNANYMFRLSAVTDLSDINITYCQGAYAMCREATHLEKFGNLNIRYGSNISQMFHSCSNLTSVGTLNVGANATYDNAFYNCKKLVTVTFVGTIGNNLDMSACPLNKTSIESILNCLSTTTSGKTLTLKSRLVDTAFETSEGAADGRQVFEELIATKTNWAFSY